MKINKNILILSFSNLSREPRVYRQIMFLKDNYNVITAGFDRSKFEGITNIYIDNPVNKLLKHKIPLALLMKAGFHNHCYWNFPVIRNALTTLNSFLITNNISPDLIIAHDPITLPLSLSLASGYKSKVIFDAHEYSPRQYEDQWISIFFNKFWDSICRDYIPKCSAMITVCQGIAEEYEKNYGMLPETITNAPFYYDLQPSKTCTSKIRLIYHGIVHPSRDTEKMVSLINLLDNRFSLDFMIQDNNSTYVKKIYKLARNNDRITFKKPVPMLDIPYATNGYDMGLFLLSQKTFSYRMALPNKLFEYVQARLAVAIWPSPEMARVVTDYECGIVAEDFSLESMAKRLNALSADDILKYKHNSHVAARSLCAESNKDKFLSLVEGLIGI